MQVIKLDRMLSYKELQWLQKNVGPRNYWLHDQIGGDGWAAKKVQGSYVWELKFDDEKNSTAFILIFK